MDWRRTCPHCGNKFMPCDKYGKQLYCERACQLSNQRVRYRKRTAAKRLANNRKYWERNKDRLNAARRERRALERENIKAAKLSSRTKLAALFGATP